MIRMKTHFYWASLGVLAGLFGLAACSDGNESEPNPVSFDSGAKPDGATGDAVADALDEGTTDGAIAEAGDGGDGGDGSVQQEGCTQSIAAGDTHTCALRLSGSIACWGSNASGQAGQPPPAEEATKPAEIAGQFKTIVKIAASNSFTCFLNNINLVMCFGANDKGQLGAGEGTEPDPTHVPIQLNVTNDTFVDFAIGDAHGCAVGQAKSLYCWGENKTGQLGLATSSEVERTPQPVVALTAPVASVACGAGHTCAIAESALYCWGDNTFGQLGTGNADSAPAGTVKKVELPEGKPVKVALGASHTCALNDSGKVYCWGANGKYQLGTSDADKSYAPRLVEGLAAMDSIAAGKSHSCAMSAKGEVWCWGDNSSGQLGNGSSGEAKAAAAKVNMAVPASSISAGYMHTCAMGKNAVGYCWGRGSNAEIGDGSKDATKTTPTKVVLGCTENRR